MTIDMKRFIFFIISLEIFAQIALYSQNNSIYLPPIYKKAYDKGTRSFDGKPGPKYWTNHSEYNINASFDPSSKKLKGIEEIVYYNNSPDTLKIMVIKTWQDIYKKESPRDNILDPKQLTDGMNIISISVSGNIQDLNNRKQISRYGTNMIVRLQPDKYISPGNSIKLEISWDYIIAINGIREGALTDSTFFIGYWYPQMAVYDDCKGWDFNIYTGGQETYNDLADYKVELTLPSNYLIWATGDLLNGSDIYSETMNKKIEDSKKTKDIIKIISEEDYKGKILKAGGNVTWKYNAKHVPDFAWAASSYYLWDATTAVIESSSNRTVWVNSIYSPTAVQFKNAITYAKNGIEFFSSTLPGIPYVYDKHYSFNGHNQTAMEFPMMANNLDNPAEDYIYEITVHEIAHGYMPFMVNTNEEEYAWMDEGFVKLFGEMALEQKGVKRPDSKYLNTLRYYKNLAKNIYDVPLMTPSSSINPDYDFATSYAKSANALYFLIQIMGERGIEHPLKLFMETWRDKHPTPYDFFFYMNTLAKEDLAWFWKPWFFEFALPDIGISEIKQDSKGSRVILNSVGGLPIPVTIKITYSDNSEETYSKSASIWKSGNTYSLNIPNKKKIISVQLGDPYSVDINSVNDTYKVK